MCRPLQVGTALLLLALTLLMVGAYVTLTDCQTACITSAIEENNTTKQLLKITDELGMESKPRPNVPLFYRYDDGTVEKRIVVE